MARVNSPRHRPDVSEPARLVEGNDLAGRLERWAADARVALPLALGVESLNVPVAVGAVLYEVVRQRRQPEKSEFSITRLERP